MGAISAAGRQNSRAAGRPPLVGATQRDGLFRSEAQQRRKQDSSSGPFREHLQMAGRLVITFANVSCHFGPLTARLDVRRPVIGLLLLLLSCGGGGGGCTIELLCKLACRARCPADGSLRHQVKREKTLCF